MCHVRGHAPRLVVALNALELFIRDRRRDIRATRRDGRADDARTHGGYADAGAGPLHRQRIGESHSFLISLHLFSKDRPVLRVSKTKGREQRIINRMVHL